MLRAVFAAAALLFMAACGADPTWAPDAEVSRARHVSQEPPSITVVTVVNDRNNSGAHTGLYINASESVLFDPAGTFSMPGAPVRNDVHYGLDQRMINFYRDYHARDTEKEKFHVIERKVPLTAAQAELVLQRAKDYGAVPKAYCTLSIARILRGVPGLEGLPSTFFPLPFGEAVELLPGVTKAVFTEENDNPGAGHGIVLIDDDGVQVN